jgi:acetylornithine deacetylase/succinyl-diaminopimelate desuccinylase-like protein
MDRFAAHVDANRERYFAELCELLQQPSIAAQGIAIDFLGGVRGIERLKTHLFSPTCTICGLISGYTGAGSKTVLPSEARAKIDFRMVPDQDPHEIVRLLRAYLDASGFADIAIAELGHERAGRSSPDAPVVRAIARATQATYGQAPVVYPSMEINQGGIVKFTARFVLKAAA